jgi:FkbM family methyltransferase
VDELEVTLASGVRMGITPDASRIETHFLLAAEDAPDHVWEPQTTRLLALLARDTAHVIVGGAYIGDQAVPLAHGLAQRDPVAIVHAFEPMAWAFERLVRNVNRNGLTNVRCHRLALWSRPATGLRLAGEPALASVSTGGDGERIDATSIDAYCDEEGIEGVGLVMLDLEGGEETALRGCEAQLALPPANAPAVIFEVHRANVDWSEGLERTPIIRALLGHGYTALAIRDFHGNRAMGDKPIELVPIDGVYLGGPPHGFNVLAVKDPQELDRMDVRVVPGVSPKLLPDGDPRLHHPVEGSWLAGGGRQSGR